MQIADLFETGIDWRLEVPSHQARVQRYRTGNDPVAASLHDSGLIDEACCIVEFLTEDFTTTESSRDALFEFCVLVLAVHRNAPQIRHLDDPDDLESLATAGDGAFGSSAGPMSDTVARLVSALRQTSGWALGGPAVLERLRTATSSLAQTRSLQRVTVQPLSPALIASTRGAWKEALLEAACVVCDDEGRRTADNVADAVGRLLASTVTLASELSPFVSGTGDTRAIELVTQRFALSPRIVQLDGKQIIRALRATLELEVRDLLDALRHLDPLGARAQLTRRLVLAMLTADASARAVVEATSSTPPERDELMQRMRAAALVDGTVTADERNLLRRFDTQLHAFTELLARIEEDRAVDFEEFLQLRQTRQSILDELFQAALADAEINEDERELLLLAMELVPKLRARA